MKQSEVRILARDYYVKNGYSVDTILRMLPAKVSRKTVYNWRNEENWDELRKRELKRSDTVESMIYDIMQVALDKALEDPSPKNILAAHRALGLYKGVETARPQIDKTDKDEEKKPAGISEKTAKMIEDLLMIKLEQDDE